MSKAKSGRKQGRTESLDTEGARQLRKALAAKKKAARGGIAEVAEVLGVSWQSLWAYRAGTRRPSLGIRIALRSLFRIPPEAWMTPEEKREASRLRASLKFAAA